MDEYHQGAVTPWATVGAYVLLTIVVAVLTLDRSIPEYAGLFLGGLLVLYLGRLLSLSYSIRDGVLRAQRLFGTRHAELKDIRKVEPRSLRDISPVSFVGGWGWRSRMWSPVIGNFDNLSSIHRGLMIYAGEVPFFISPRDPDAFLDVLQKETGESLIPD
jgi:hypothetical protein